MTKRGYKAILRAIIRANFWGLNPNGCYVYSPYDLDITTHRLRAFPRELRTFNEYKARHKRLCEAVADFWPYRRAFVDKLAALFADREQFCDHSYANDVILVKYALSVGRCRYADLVEETTGEKFANERERAAFEDFAEVTHSIMNDLYWDFDLELF